MSHDAFDRLPESSIPAELSDGRSGDRVAVLGAGVLYVREGLASFLPWDRIYGVTELEGRLHILAPRPLPAAPWYTVHPSMMRGRPAELAERIRNGRPGGGYRGAVRAHRARLSRDELVSLVQNRAPFDGGLTVLGSVPDTSLETGIVLARYCLVSGALALVYPWYLLCEALLTERDVVLAAMIGGAGIVIVALLAAWAIGPVARWAWRHVKPRRVLVLAPDGCVVGLPSGVRSFRWDELGPFRTQWRNQVEAIVVESAGGARLGELSAQYVRGPVKLLAAVANTYHEAAG